MKRAELTCDDLTRLARLGEVTLYDGSDQPAFALGLTADAQALLRARLGLDNAPLRTGDLRVGDPIYERPGRGGAEGQGR